MQAAAQTEGLSDDEWEFLTQDPDGFDLYAETALVIRTKSGALEPFQINSSQRVVDKAIELMHLEIGYARIIVLKGRQQGISTYIGGRFFRKTTTRQGQRALVMTHKLDATQALFEMTQRFHEHCPPELRPEAGRDNANQLDFKRLDGGYRVATAGGTGVGRGFTFQYVHCSEYGYWKDAENNLTGILEAMPKEPEAMIGTEAVIESTARKPGDAFHRLWRAAKEGKSVFRAVFVPWFVHEEYVMQPPADWTPNKVFADYQARHGLTDAQTYWAYINNRDAAVLRGMDPEEFCPAFQREYPATDEEAFEAAGNDISRVFPRDWVMAAVARWKVNADKPKERMHGVGVDVAQGGDDKTVISSMRGKRFAIEASLPGKLTINGPAVAAGVFQYVRDNATIAVDTSGGWGGDALTQLKQGGQKALGINSGAGSDYKVKTEVVGENGRKEVQVLYGMRNMRAELHRRLHEGLNPESGEDLEIPDDPELIEEMLAITFEIPPQGMQVVAKEDLAMAESLGRSPDKLDSILLAYHAARLGREEQAREVKKKRPPPPPSSGGSWMG